MVVEFGFDQSIVKCVGFLYDIGKVVDYEMEGLYVLIGYEFVKKYKEINLDVFEVIGGYYGEMEIRLIYNVLIQVVDFVLVV